MNADINVLSPTGPTVLLFIVLHSEMPSVTFHLSYFPSKRSRIDSLSSNYEVPLSITLSHLVEKQKMSINGYFNYNAMVFIQQVCQGWYLIALGLYPIASDCKDKIFYVLVGIHQLVKGGD